MNEDLITMNYYFSKLSDKLKNKFMKKIKSSYKQSIRKQTRDYIKKNNIEFKCCAICGDEFYVENHHVDYEKPYLIVPLCVACHAKQHSKKAIEVIPINLLEVVNVK